MPMTTRTHLATVALVTAAVIVATAISGWAEAPFCVVAAFGRQCFYYDAPSCQQAAAAARGACVANVPAQDASGGAPFCLVSGFGAQCAYYDMDACRSAARSVGAACVVNPRP
jgi:hypothetical protein